MRTVVKRTYCGKCRRLVMPAERNFGEIMGIYCQACNCLLYEWDGIRWTWKRELAPIAEREKRGEGDISKEHVKAEKKKPTKLVRKKEIQKIK